VIDEAETVRLLVTLDRAELYMRADARFSQMIAGGAMEEARALAGLDANLPAMRAIGLRPLLSVIRGEKTAESAAEVARLETRQYIKRQLTWFRRNMITWKNINLKYMERSMREIFPFI
jgi:tRNA dimethylallyltransferase